MLVCESMTILAYPFIWPHVYVPILPPSLENFLDAPVPYVMGLLRRAHDVELYQKGGVCIVDIDNGELDLPEELPDFPCESDLKEEIESIILEVDLAIVKCMILYINTYVYFLIHAQLIIYFSMAVKKEQLFCGTTQLKLEIFWSPQ